MDKILAPIKQRIVEYLEKHDIAKTSFYEQFEIASSNFRGKGLESEAGGELLAKILTHYKDINPEWLLTGKEPMLKQDTSVARMTRDQKGVPLVSLAVAAGFGSNDFVITEQDIEANYVVPDFNDIDFMIRVKGNSMYPKYSSGDVIACRKLTGSKFIQWNKCHVIATHEQGLLVKRLKKGSSEKKLLAISDNKEYDPFEIPVEEILGIALVIGVIRLE